MIKENCYCGSNTSFQDCCEPILNGIKKATTAEALMRSRYTAFATHKVDYLVATIHSSQRQFHLREEILNWAITNHWEKLEIIAVTETSVEFKASYNDGKNVKHIHHEFSNFIFENDEWFYVDGEFY